MLAQRADKVQALIGCRNRGFIGSGYSRRGLIGFTVPRLIASLLCVFTLTLNAAPAVAADIDSCRKLLVTGKYEDALQQAQAAIDNKVYGESWHVLRVQAQVALGKYADAKASVAESIKRYGWSIQLRYLAHEVLLHNGEEEAATDVVLEIDTLVSKSAWRYTDAEDLVTLGKTALLVGVDARQVLEAFYDRAKKNHPRERAPWIASGELALFKQDKDLAADTFRKASATFKDDPDILFGLARSIRSVDPERAIAALNKTLQINPNHAAALLYQADMQIDSENYVQAHKLIDQVLKVNPRHSLAWAYRAVLAHLASDEKREKDCREEALSTWAKNPEVDYTIGRKLSQKYRFTEGAAYQQKALAFENLYMPARVQLSQDLLRLGMEKQGWELAESTHKLDGYDTTTFNLLQLRGTVDKFKTIENDHFVLRMDANEAAIYGDRVLALLERARAKLTKKYDLQLEEKTTVEIFPDENDFAVRTFGMPAVSGFLGVCFGNVITANSPASQGESPSNWESVLWHEFCHVITLTRTENKMPRWLSEGISVYEEVQENPTWGQTMNPQYFKMIMDGELTPVAELSSAFLSPKSGAHLQFAYFQSSLVVEYIVQEFGEDALRAILLDLKKGIRINDTLDRHTDGLKSLDKQFGRFVDSKMAAMAPDADWVEPPDVDALAKDEEALDQWLKEHPKHYIGMAMKASRLLRGKQFDEALPILKKMAELFPGNTGLGSPYAKLASIYRQRGDEVLERETLEILVGNSSDEVAAMKRLLAIQSDAGDWPQALKTADDLLAVNPLLPATHRTIAKAAEETEKPEMAISAYQTLIAMKPSDPAVIHFRLAQLLYEKKDPSAKRHVLMSLEEAPRFLEAHQLLLKMTRDQASVGQRQSEADSPGDKQGDQQATSDDAKAGAK